MSQCRILKLKHEFPNNVMTAFQKHLHDSQTLRCKESAIKLMQTLTFFEFLLVIRRFLNLNLKCHICNG